MYYGFFFVVNRCWLCWRRTRTPDWDEVNYMKFQTQFKNRKWKILSRDNWSMKHGQIENVNLLDCPLLDSDYWSPNNGRICHVKQQTLEQVDRWCWVAAWVNWAESSEQQGNGRRRMCKHHHRQTPGRWRGAAANSS